VSKLLTRSTRGLTPTEAGLGYFERAKRAIEEADEAELAARGAGTGLKGRLARLPPQSHLLAFTLIPLLPQFPRTTPGPQSGSRARTTARSTSCRRASIWGCGWEDAGLGPDSFAASVDASDWYWVRPATSERAGTPATPADLSKHQAVVYLQGEGSVWSFRRDSSEVGGQGPK